VEGIDINDSDARGICLAVTCQSMSKIRQSLSEEGFVVRSLATDYRGGARLDEHRHEWPQLVYAARGVMTVEVDDGSWVVPAHRAVWVPARATHSIEMTGSVAMRTLYFSPGLVEQLPARCETVDVPPLLRELILETIRLGMLHRGIPEHAHLIGVMTDQLARIEAAPLRLPMPQHPRLRVILDRLRHTPLDDMSLETIAKDAGMSVRTLERTFAAETDLTFVQWRQRMRMLHALRMLATDEPVINVALAVGYQGASAFIAAFKRELGVTPSEYHNS
jgi:AraC-like DNA-binding protein/quercetin dioxygenase-like cupin family protein